MAPVLVTGESGTGKELFSQLIHDASSRSAGPMIRVNCAALSETLIAVSYTHLTLPTKRIV